MTGAHVPPAQMAAEARRALEGVYFDTMAGTGMSGALVVPILARALDKHWLIVRKENDHHHHKAAGGPENELAEGTLGERWLFVDDGADTGATYRRMREIVPSLNPGTRFAGAYFYGDNGAGRLSPLYVPEDKLEARLGEGRQDPYDELARLLEQLGAR